jgi:transcriptional regulator with XRE-family HTH domain
VSKSAARKAAAAAVPPELARLNQLRLERDLSYGALAGEIGLDPAALHRILHDRERPRDRTLFKIQKFLERAAADEARTITRTRRARRVA